MEWYVTNGSKLIRPHYKGLVRMSHMYGIWCVQFFFFGKPLVKNTFFKSFPKKTLRFWISKIRICTIRRIHPSVDFIDSWSVFEFAQKKRKSVFGFGNPDLDFPKKTHPKCRYFHLSVHVVVELSSNIMRGKWGFRLWPKNALLWQITRNQSLVGIDQAVDTLRNTVSVPEGHVWFMALAWF